MAFPTESHVLDALRTVQDPDLHRDIVALGFVKDLRLDGGSVAFTIELTTPACPVKDRMRDQAHAAVSRVAGVSEVQVTMTASVRSVKPVDARAPIPGVKNIIAVGAGKGGVGKTTVAVNLAVALARSGGRVGMIDGDVYGPNVPIMLGIAGAQLMADEEQKIVPPERYGIKAVSMGFLATNATHRRRGPSPTCARTCGTGRSPSRRCTSPAACRTRSWKPWAPAFPPSSRPWLPTGCRPRCCRRAGWRRHSPRPWSSGWPCPPSNGGRWPNRRAWEASPASGHWPRCSTSWTAAREARPSAYRGQPDLPAISGV